MRRAFTLIELLVIIGILAAVTGMAAISVRRNQDAVRLRVASRAAFASVRLARSTALVTQKPSVLTFSTVQAGESGAWQSKITIESANIIDKSAPAGGRTLDGEWINFGEDSAGADGADADAADSGGGESVQEILFKPVEKEVLKDVCIKVEMDRDDTLPMADGEADEARTSRISIYSNVDYLLGRYREKQAAAAAEAAKAADAQAAETGTPAVRDETEECSIAWQVNGRCEPHRIRIYEPGADPRDGWLIRVDRFGAAKVYAPGEQETGP